MSSIYDIDNSVRRAMREDAFKAAEAKRNAALEDTMKRGNRLLAEMKALRTEEAKLDAQIKTAPTWSEKWWLLLGRLNMVRRDRIASFEVMREFR